MSIAKTVVTVVIATFGVAGCSDGVEGTYKFDKAETAKAMAADMDKRAKGVQASDRGPWTPVQSSPIRVQDWEGVNRTIRNTLQALRRLCLEVTVVSLKYWVAVENRKPLCIGHFVGYGTKVADKRSQRLRFEPLYTA